MKGIRGYIFSIVWIIVMLSGCGGGGGGSTSGSGQPSNVGSGWITITSQPTGAINASSASLSGEMFISPGWSGCTVSYCVSGVTVTCQNQTTGLNGTVQQSVDICYFFGTGYPCNNTWYADVPLVLGSNSILVSASDGSGNVGYASCVVVR